MFHRGHKSLTRKLQLLPGQNISRPTQLGGPWAQQFSTVPQPKYRASHAEKEGHRCRARCRSAIWSALDENIGGNRRQGH